MSALSISYLESDVRITNFLAELAPQNGGKTAGIDMIRRNYVTVTRCIVTMTAQPRFSYS